MIGKPKSYYHAIMFDFDGTIVDTMHEYADIASEEISRMYQLSVETAKQLYLETSGIPFFQQLDVIFGNDNRNARCAKKFEKRKALFLENVQLKQNVKEVLLEIRAMGLSIAITSNNYQELVEKSVKEETDLFDIILGYSDKFSKGPTQFMRVIDTFGIDRRYILFVGDSLTDVRISLAFGIDFVAISGTLKKESFISLFPAVPVISSIEELIEILKIRSPVSSINK